MLVFAIDSMLFTIVFYPSVNTLTEGGSIVNELEDGGKYTSVAPTPLTQLCTMRVSSGMAVLSED